MLTDAYACYVPNAVRRQRDWKVKQFSKLLLGIGDGNIFMVEGKINIPNHISSIIKNLISLTDKIYSNIHQ